jgi:hypothetical protein
MVQTSCFEKFLEVLVQLLRLAIEIVLSSHDILLIGVIHFLVVVVVIIAGGNSDPLGVPLLPFLLPLAPFLTPLPTALGGAPGCHRGPLSHHPGQR